MKATVQTALAKKHTVQLRPNVAGMAELETPRHLVPFAQARL
jgi:hypothetical protein